MLSQNQKIIDEGNATVDPLQLSIFNEKNITASVLRLDKIHPVISGNKWFKLKYFINEAIEKKQETSITFGGAYSNHIIAAACAAKMYNIKSVAIIRGEKPENLSHTLIAAEKYGMQLIFISRENYKLKNDFDFINNIKEKFPNSLIIPEGGADVNGIKGSEEILSLIKENYYTHILCAIGTGTMFCGIANSLLINQKLIGISVLKGMDNLLITFKKNINEEKINNCEIIYDYHFGGYAKKNNELISFMNSFYKQTLIPTDFVYTAKLFYAAINMVEENYFPPLSKLLIIHSGGLQGNLSLPTETLTF